MVDSQASQNFSATAHDQAVFLLHEAPVQNLRNPHAPIPDCGSSPEWRLQTGPVDICLPRTTEKAPLRACLHRNSANPRSFASFSDEQAGN